MKKLAIILFSGLLLVGCSNTEKTTKLEDEAAALKSDNAQLEAENKQLTEEKLELEQKLDEYENNSNELNPSDEYASALNATLNMALDFFEAINENDLEKIEEMLAAKATLNKEAKEIQFGQGDSANSISLDSYQYPLGDFQYRGAGFGKDSQTFNIFFSFVGGDGDGIYNIETEMHFINENGTWKLELVIS